MSVALQQAGIPARLAEGILQQTSACCDTEFGHVTRTHVVLKAGDPTRRAIPRAAIRAVRREAIRWPRLGLLSLAIAAVWLLAAPGYSAFPVGFFATMGAALLWGAPVVTIETTTRRIFLYGLPWSWGEARRFLTALDV